MLAIVAGLHAIDIARLKLTGIDWRTGEINFIQSKTGQNLQLPLTTDIGEVLRDYILNGRPKLQEPEVFLWLNPPCVGRHGISRKTTLVYAYADTEHKCKALETSIDPNRPLAKRRNPQRYTLSDDETVKKLYGLV